MGHGNIDAALETDGIFLSQVLLRAISRQSDIKETINLDERAGLGFASDDVREYEFHVQRQSEVTPQVKPFRLLFFQPSSNG